MDSYEPGTLHSLGYKFVLLFFLQVRSVMLCDEGQTHQAQIVTFKPRQHVLRLDINFCELIYICTVTETLEFAKN